jgi:hypothetical protein
MIGKQKMPKRIIKNQGVKRVTLWVNETQWVRFGKIVGNKSESIREYIDRIVSKNLDKLKGTK